MTTTPAPSITTVALTGTLTGPFATGWRYADADDVVVTIETDGLEGEPLSAGPDYTLTAASPLVGGGTVTLAGAGVPVGGWPNNTRIILTRRTTRRQTVALPDTEGHKPRATERALDKAMRISEEDRDTLDRALILPPGEAGLRLPSANRRTGGRVLGFDRDTGEATMLDGGAFKGDPGGNVMAVGLFVDLPNMAIPLGTDLIQTSGWAAVGSGSARYVAVPAGPSSAFRRQTQNGRWFELDEVAPSPRMFGAVGDGITDDTGPVQALIDRLAPGASAHLDAGSYRVGAGLLKLYTPVFTGPGRLVRSAVQGGQYATSSYADAGQAWMGREYLYRLFLRIKVGGTLKGFIYGDSTVATAANGGGYAGVEGEPQNLMARMLRRKGVRNPINLTNRGVGGSSWAAINAAADAAPDGSVDLMIFKSSINQVSAGDAFAEASAIRSKIAAVRATSHGTVDQIAVVLMMPNATFDPQHGRASLWYEKLRSVYEAIARELKCFLFDTYGELRDVEWAATAALGFMMDNPFGNGQGVHPTEIMQSLIWGGLVDAMIGYSDLVLYDNNDTVPLTMTNGWVNYGEGWKNAYASMDREGWVQLGGLVKSGPVGVGQAVAVVPAGYEPRDADLFGVPTATGSCRLRMLTSGVIEQGDANASATYTSLSGIRYKVR